MRILFNTWPRKYAEIHLRELEESRVSLFAASLLSTGCFLSFQEP
jgi:hypothetical protein